MKAHVKTEVRRLTRRIAKAERRIKAAKNADREREVVSRLTERLRVLRDAPAD